MAIPRSGEHVHHDPGDLRLRTQNQERIEFLISAVGVSTPQHSRSPTPEVSTVGLCDRLGTYFAIGLLCRRATDNRTLPSDLQIQLPFQYWGQNTGECDFDSWNANPKKAG